MRRWFGALCALAVIVTACTKTNTTETTVASTSSTVVSTTAATTTESTLSAPDTVNPALLEAVPIDPKVRIGTLENGLTYYIRFNDSPGGRAELRLAVDAGSVLEDDDQSGGAHFLEHMMFNGTEQYPANDLIAVLEAFGPQFGPDINAYTSFDETVYELSVPTDNPAILLEAMKVLVQWAAHATLMQDDVEGERGVVVEEWRVRDQGLGGRISSVFGELVLTGTAYEGQEPIGEFDSISQMDAAPLRRFYQDWYQPELMAVVVVGDVDVDEVESLIEQHFGALQGPDVPLRRPGLTVNAPTVSEVATLADPEATSPSVDIFYMVDGVSPIATVGDLQNTTALAIAMQILETRLIEDALRGDVPFFAAATFEFFYSRAIAAHGLNASADASELESTARSLLREVARTSEFGFTDTEFDRARRLLEALNEQLREGQESRQDAQFAASYVAHFLAAAPIPSVDQLYDIQRESLARITLAEVEAAFVDLVSASAPRIFVVGPDEPAGAVPPESTLLALIDEVAQLTLEPRPAEEAAPEQLMQAPAEVAAIVVNENPTFGFVELDYGNGARVLFWPTDIADNLVSFAASSFGGLSQVAVEDLTEIEFGIEMIGQSGLASLDQVAVDRVLSDQLVGLGASIDLTHEGFNGSASTEDLETLFQWIHLAISEPRIDDVAVTSTLTEARPQVESPEDVPSLLTSIALSKAYYGPDDDRHWVIPPLDEFNAFDPDRALEVYRDRFGNVGEFLFVFVGDADPDRLIELANRYIGSLPGSAGDEGFVDHQPLPTGVKVATVEAGQDPQGLVQFQFTNRYPDQDVRTDVIADLLEFIANNRLRDRIREALSATYSPFLVVDMQLEPDPYVETYVSVSGDPDRLDEIAQEVLADIADLRTNGPTDEQLVIAQEQLFREYELINNPFLIERLIFFEEHEGRELEELIDRYDVIETITASDIRALARAAFPSGSYIEVKLIPAS